MPTPENTRLLPFLWSATSPYVAARIGRPGGEEAADAARGYGEPRLQITLLCPRRPGFSSADARLLSPATCR